MGILSAYLSLFSQPLVPPPDAAEDLESSSSPHPSKPSSSHSQAHHPSPQEEYEPVELGTIPARPSMMFRARSSFMKMVGATRDAEAAGLNGAGGEGGGILSGGGRERSGSKSYGSTGTTENGGGDRPNVGGRLESSREVHHVIGEEGEGEEDGRWMKQGEGVRL